MFPLLSQAPRPLESSHSVRALAVAAESPQHLLRGPAAANDGATGGDEEVARVRDKKEMPF